jgi:1,4-dihydroxy-2-naphthoate octaprenyltransferase
MPGALRRVWWPAARPRTLGAAVSPVLLGTGLAARDGAFHALAAAAALLGALLLQVGTNYANDYCDFVHGADSDARLGPPRATQQGWVQSATMRRACWVVFGAAAAVGVYLVARAGWPIALVGIAGIACGVLYTAGPRPLGYLGGGEILVLLFFGPVAVAGTHYVQALRWSPTAAIAGLGPGLLATCLLAVNNLRDIATDRVAGKRTLAVRWGARFAKVEYAAALAGAALVPAALALAERAPPWSALASAACLLALPAAREVWASRPGETLHLALAGTGRALLAYGALFALGCATAPAGGGP